MKALIRSFGSTHLAYLMQSRAGPDFTNKGPGDWGPENSTKHFAILIPGIARVYFLNFVWQSSKI